MHDIHDLKAHAAMTIIGVIQDEQLRTMDDTRHRPDVRLERILELERAKKAAVTHVERVLGSLVRILDN